MNSFAGKAVIFTQGAMASIKKQADTAESGVVVPPESPVTSNGGDSAKKKKKKNKKRNSKTALVEEEEDDALATGSTVSAASSEPSPVAPPPVVEVAAGEALKPVKEDPFASSQVDLPSPVAAPAAFATNGASPFDVFDAPQQSSVVVAASSPPAPAASGRQGNFDWTAPPPAPVSTVDIPASASVEPPPTVETPVLESILAPPQEEEPVVEVPVVFEPPVELTPVAPAPALAAAHVAAPVAAPPFEKIVDFFTSPPPAPVATEVASMAPVASRPAPPPVPQVFEAVVVEELAPPATEPSPVTKTAAVVTTTTAAEKEFVSMNAIESAESVEEDEVVYEEEIATSAIEPEEIEIDAPVEQSEPGAESELEVEAAVEEEVYDEETQIEFHEELELEVARDEITHTLDAEEATASVVVQDVNVRDVVENDDEIVASPVLVFETAASPKPALAPSPAAAKSSKPTSAVAKPQTSRVGASASTAASRASSNGAAAVKPRPVPPTKPTTAPVAKPATTTASIHAPVPKPATATAAKKPTLQRALSGPAVGRRPTKTPPKTVATSPSGLTSASPRAASSPVGPDGELRPVKKKLSASEIDAAGNRLYEQAMESKRRLEARKAKLEEEFTFTPQVNAKSKKIDTTDAPDRFAMLHERAKESQRKKEEMREKLEKEQYTFKPQITAKAKKIGSTTDRFENLYKNAQEIQAKRGEKKKQELEKKEEDFTFKPKINTTKSPVKSRPLYDPEVVKQKRLELEQKKMEAELQSKPKVIKKVRAEDGDNKIFDRLYQGSQQRAERIAKLKQERDEQERATTTFQPKVSAAGANAKTTKQPFHTRLYDKDHLKKVTAEREQKKLEEERQQFSFKPKVSEMPDSVKSKGSQEGSTGKSSIFERLYQDKDRVKEKMEMSEELKIQKEMEECTFRPSIDVPPVGGAKSESATPIWERLLSVDKNQIVEERERQKELQELEACTFRPEISPTPGSLSPKRASTNNIFDRLSVSGGNTPVDEQKRRPSERKPSSIGAHGKRNSYNERVSPKPQESTSQRRALSVGEILKTSKLSVTHDGRVSAQSNGAKSQNGGSPTRGEFVESDPAQNVARSLEMELNEDDDALASNSIAENFDSWAASMDEKMRNL